jgi:type II secretory pathway pseudopilin PulG
MSESAQWLLGIGLGAAVVLVAAAIVIAIVLLAMRIARQAATAEQAVEVLRQQTEELPGVDARPDDVGRVDVPLPLPRDVDTWEDYRAVCAALGVPAREREADLPA